MESTRQVEICQEARFVLWALRCAMAIGRGEAAAEAELALGFELADVPETRATFAEFAARLAAFDWPETVWHHQRCGCVSSEEMSVLQALAETAMRQRRGEAGATHWWRLLIPVASIPSIDAAARDWLSVLNRAGVVFPSPAELLECLQPLENLAGPARAARVH